MTYDLAIKYGTVVLPEGVRNNCCIGVKDGKIVSISEQNDIQATELIDASGLHVFPGVVDPHTHIGMAGMPKEEYYHESQHAAMGGCTTMMMYVMQKGSYLEQHAENRALADSNCMVDYTFHYAITDHAQFPEVATLMKDYGMPAYKYFLSCRGAESTRMNMEEVTDGLLYNFFSLMGTTGAIPCVHCENMEVHFSLLPGLKEAGAEGLSAWDDSRPPWVEAESIFRAVYIAAQAKCPKIYIVHLSSKAGLDMIRTLRAMNLGIEIIVETCPHYLILDVDSPCGILAKINPPIRRRENCSALWEGLKNGEIQTIGSDHNARFAKDKVDSIWKARMAFVGCGTILQAMLEYGHHQHGLTLPQISALVSRTPAEVFGIAPQKGSIAVGADADFALVDLNKSSAITSKNSGSLSDFSVYEGYEMRGTPVRTILRGRTIMLDGKLNRLDGYSRYIQ